MRAIVSGGGTGGHIYPALAIAEALQTELGAEILYMGAKTRPRGGPTMEHELAVSAGYRFAGVRAAGLRRKSPRILKDLWVNYRGVGEAKAQLRAFRPDLVVGCGGFATAPVLKAAADLGVPILIHEQNAFPGWANRHLARKADAVCLTFAAAQAHFGKGGKFYTTGLPVRREIQEATREEAYAYWGVAGAARQLPTLLVTGGSQGAERLNQALAGAYQPLLDAGLRIIHLTGEQHSAPAERAAAKLAKKENLHLMPYLKEMHQALALADLVVGRAGASFLAELAVLGLPAVLVPYPHAANDHQTHNAKAFCEVGAACLLKDADCDSARLQKLVLELIGDQERLARMGRAAADLGQRDAAAKILAVVRKMI